MSASHLPSGLLTVVGILSFVLTRLMIAVARRRNWVDQPKQDRWHKRPTVLFGGVTMFLTFAVGSLLLGWSYDFRLPYDLIGLFIGATLTFLLGLRDDIRAFNPLVKLMGQIMAVTPFLVGLGLAHMSAAFALSLPLVLLWMVGLTNAFNLLDNIDGLSAGTAIIVGSVLTVCLLMGKLLLLAAVSGLFTVSCLGFLWFNFQPKGSAQIFMGDCGSMFLGFLLAGLMTLRLFQSPLVSLSALACPLLMMAVPIFDTCLVIVLRRREGRPISQGGRDHSSHRLVYAGLTEKQAVLLLYAISLAVGSAGVMLERLGRPLLSDGAVIVCIAAMLGFGLFLQRYSGFQHAQVDAPALPTLVPAHLDANPS